MNAKEIHYCPWCNSPMLRHMNLFLNTVAWSNAIFGDAVDIQDVKFNCLKKLENRIKKNGCLENWIIRLLFKNVIFAGFMMND